MAPSVIRYRLHTEHVSPVLVGKYFEGFTLLAAGRSHWKGKSENSVVVEIIGTPADAAKVTTLAREIREQYRQNEIWITAEEVSLTRVTIDAAREGFETPELRKVS